MLLSYLVNPTMPGKRSRTWPRATAMRRPRPFLQPRPSRRHWCRCLRKHAEEAKVTSVYTDIDLPLAPVLYRMERAGVRIDKDVLARLSTRFAAEIERVGERIYRTRRRALQHQLAQAARRGAVHPHGPAHAREIRQGQKSSPPRWTCSKRLPRNIEVPRLVLEYRHLSKLKSTYIDVLPSAGRRRLARAHHLPGRRNRHRPPFIHQPQPAEHSHQNRAGPRDSRRIYRRARRATSLRRLLADRAAPAGPLQRRSAPGARLPDRRRHPHAHRQRSLRRARRNT